MNSKPWEDMTNKERAEQTFRDIKRREINRKKKAEYEANSTEDVFLKEEKKEKIGYFHKWTTFYREGFTEEYGLVENVDGKLIYLKPSEIVFIESDKSEERLVKILKIIGSCIEREDLFIKALEIIGKIFEKDKDKDEDISEVFIRVIEEYGLDKYYS